MSLCLPRSRSFFSQVRGLLFLTLTPLAPVILLGLAARLFG